MVSWRAGDCRLVPGFGNRTGPGQVAAHRELVDLQLRESWGRALRDKFGERIFRESCSVYDRMRTVPDASIRCITPAGIQTAR